MALKKVGIDHGWAGLCRNCVHAIIKEHERGTRTVDCNADYNASVRMTGPVASCNRYEAREGPRIQALERIAWRINSDEKTGIVGFLTPAQWRKKHEAPE